MRFYEEYTEAKDKGRAQRKAKPKGGKRTGLANAYLMVFDEDGTEGYGKDTCYNAVGTIFFLEPGSLPQALTHVTPCLDYLRTNCRRIALGSVPVAWRRAFAKRLLECICDNWEADYNQRYHEFLRRILGKTAVHKAVVVNYPMLKQ